MRAVMYLQLHKGDWRVSSTSTPAESTVSNAMQKATGLPIYQHSRNPRLYCTLGGFGRNSGRVHSSHMIRYLESWVGLGLLRRLAGSTAQYRALTVVPVLYVYTYSSNGICWTRAQV